MVPLALTLAASLVGSDEPSHIVDGVDATPCQWPSVVALVGESGAQFCSASVVAPRFVLTAGHCLDPDAGAPPVARVVFGENIDAPVHEIAVTGCARHPEYEVIFDERGLGSDIAADVGYCLLERDAPAEPFVPIAAGCEGDAPAAGGEAIIVGFGATAGGVIDGAKWAEGNGLKRFTPQNIELVDAEKIEVVMSGGGSSACFGDSGGPAMIALPDGSWRVFGVGSSLHPDMPTNCGYGTTYELVVPHIAWLESDSGIDITPCFADDGTWAPERGCSGFPVDPLATTPSWARLCAGDVSGESESCAPASGTEGSSGGSGGSQESSTSDAGRGEADTTSSAAESSGDGSEATGSSVDAEAAGCGCATAAGPRLWAIVLLGRRRRRHGQT